MAPLPCSPVSNSTASESQSFPTSEDSDDSLTTPRPGPSDPAQRTHDKLSRPSVPIFSTSPEAVPKLKRDGEGYPRNPYTYGARSSSGGLVDLASSSSKGGSKAIERQKSVSFSPKASSPRSSRQNSSLPYPTLITSAGAAATMGDRRASPDDTSPPHEFPSRLPRASDDYVESSADENTAIMKKSPWGARTTADYGATAAGDAQDGRWGHHDHQGSYGEQSSSADAVGGARKRKTASLRSKSGGRSAAANLHAPSREQDAHATADDGRDHDGWFKTLVEKYGSVELENKGSVARDHLALERTFLAWLRTSLSFASIGIAVTQLFRLNTSLSSSNPDALAISVPANKLRHVGKPLGATFIGISIVILLLGFHRYFESQHYVVRGKFPASRGTIIIVAFIAGALIIASLVVVLVIAPASLDS